MYMSTQRREYILRLLEQRGHLRSAELSRELGVTDETIRTDFVFLESKGLLERLHGGARYIVPTVSLQADSRLATQIAQEARKQIRPGDVVFIGDSVYARTLIATLGDLKCTVVTNSFNLVALLAPESMPQDVICVGGILNKPAGVVLGDEACRQVGVLDIDIAFFSPLSVYPNCLGYSSEHVADLVNSAYKASKRHVILAASNAVMSESPYLTEELKYDLLITEDNLPEDWPDMPMSLVPYVAPVIIDPSRPY